MSDSEEDEYNNTGIVYDSENSDEDFDSEDEELVNIHDNFIQSDSRESNVFDTAYVCHLIWNWSQQFNLLMILLRLPRPV